MLREEIKQLKTGPRELRHFGLLVGGVLTFLGLWFWWRGKARYPGFLAPGIVLMVLGALFTRALRSVYICWMAVALVLGWIVSNVLLTFFFYFIVAPIGLIAQLTGTDFLHRRFDPQAKSYWLNRDRSASKQKRNYERQF